MENTKHIGVIGAGSFGTSLAVLLANKGHSISLWARREEQIKEMKALGTNEKYLKGVKLPQSICFTNDLELAIKDKDILLFAVPTQTFRSVLIDAKPYIKNDIPVVNVAKGIEKGSLLRLSQVAREIIPDIKYVALSGPSHAEEVAKCLPTTVTVASDDLALATYIQEVFNTERFRVYTNDDILGVELGGALKNIIALGAGISDGLGFGDNAKAAMMTRGITEMTRLGITMGAKSKTFSGLTGIGDLIVTCTSMHSRNRKCGILIGQGKSTDEAVKAVGMVVEGISTCEAAYELAKKLDIQMPITESIYGLINGEITPIEAVEQLMNRKMKNEMQVF